MKVSEIMTRDVKSVLPDTNLAEAALTMWTNDCGTLPVVDPDGHVSGILTDRDICMAAATKHHDISNVTVRDLGLKQVETCSLDSHLEDALDSMARSRVRRLPVIDVAGKLAGIISIRDIVMVASDERGAKGTGVNCAEVLKTLRIIGTPATKSVGVSA